jgi:hypothetical protein
MLDVFIGIGVLIVAVAAIFSLAAYLIDAELFEARAGFGKVVLSIKVRSPAGRGRRKTKRLPWVRSRIPSHSAVTSTRRVASRTDASPHTITAAAPVPDDLRAALSRTAH